MNIYSKKFISVIRILAIMAICFFAVATGLELYKIATNQVSSYVIISMIGCYANLATMILCCILIIFPSRIEIVGIISLFYCFFISIIEPFSIIPQFMFFLAYAIFLLRRFYITRTKLKTAVTIILYIVILILPSLFVEYEFWDVIFLKTAFTFGLIVFSFLISTYSADQQNKEPAPANSKKVLNIALYENLTERDSQWLNSILNNEKYESIAIDHNMSLGSVKNRLKIVFQTLQVGDRIGFLNKYSHYQIIYTPEI